VFFFQGFGNREMNYPQRNRALSKCIRDRLERADYSQDDIAYRLLNNGLFFIAIACSFFTSPYEWIHTMVSRMVHGADL